MVHELQNLGRLNGLGAELLGHLFENETTGVKLGIYWRLHIKCHQIKYLNEDWNPSVHFDWLTTADVKQRELTSASSARIESSFYMRWHDPVPEWRLRFEHGNDELPVRAHYDLNVAYSGYNKDALSRLAISGSADVTDVSIMVIPENLKNKPRAPAEAKTMLAQYFPDISAWTVLNLAQEHTPAPHSFIFSRAPAVGKNFKGAGHR